MRFLVYLATALTSVHAFPSLMNGEAGLQSLVERMDPVAVQAAMDETEAMYKRMEKRSLQKRNLSQQQKNCGGTPCPIFDAKEQFVSGSGEHAYKAPTSEDIRGPCPGLNAAANHGYLTRNGIQTIPGSIDGLGQMYGMSVDLAGFLAAYAVVFSGDLLTQTWSIGGPPPASTLGSGVLSHPQGISYSHNKYEGDTSIARNDAYMANGDAHSMNITKFKIAYESCTDGLCTIDKYRQAFLTNVDEAIATNPMYFAPLFSTTLVAPAAYTLVIVHMSNHTAENTEGYLTTESFKSWFGVTGEYPNFTWQKGQERMPDNWYRRPSLFQYTAENVIQDLLVSYTSYPRSFRLGGNVNGVNTYVGVDPAGLSGGTYTAENLFKNNNFGCFVFQTQQQAVPDQLKGLLSDASPALDLLDKYSAPLTGGLACPKLAKYDASPFNKYPGRTYNPKGGDNSY